MRLLFVSLVVLLSRQVSAAPASIPEPTTKVATPAKPPPVPLEAIVHGLFVEAQVGGGYALANAKVSVSPVANAPQVNEGYGAGSFVYMAMGYDLSDVVGLELVGGEAFLSGKRSDRVRDLGVAFVGAALRLNLKLDDRLNCVVQGGGAFAHADDRIEKPQTGAAVTARFGLEYFVHVRHFSVGLSVTVLAPLAPTRLFVGVGPELKYAF